MVCGKETFFSPGTISSTLHQVKFNCFHFLESLGVSPAGGGAQRRRWKISLGLIHFTLELYPSSFCHWWYPTFQPGKPLLKNLKRKITEEEVITGLLLGREHIRGESTLKAMTTHATIITIKQLEYLILPGSLFGMFLASHKVVHAVPGKQNDTQGNPFPELWLNHVQENQNCTGQVLCNHFIHITTGCYPFREDSRSLSYLIINHMLKFLTEYLNEDYGNYSTERMSKGKIKDPC